MRDWRAVGTIEKPDHNLKQFRGVEVEKLYCEIGDVAEMLGVTTPTIRFWLLEMDIPIKRNRQGKRQFTKEDVELMKAISWLAQRFKLEYVKELFYSRRIERVYEFHKSLERKPLIEGAPV